MPAGFADLADGALAVLAATDPAEKIRLSAEAAAAWRSGRLPVGRALPPDRPGRPARPALLPPGRMPRRRIGPGPNGRIALLHAVAHIELNAIDLAWDLIARFGHADLPRAFLDDWVTVGAEEAIHFGMVAGRLAELGAGYGDLPAHDGLWQAAQDSAGDLLTRLAIVPLVLEARGLDVTPAMIARLIQANDPISAAILTRIHDDEIGHVAAGLRWFTHVAAQRGLEPAGTWRDLVRRHFRGQIKPPFNTASRTSAGLPPDWYLDLAPAPVQDSASLNPATTAAEPSSDGSRPMPDLPRAMATTAPTQ